MSHMASAIGDATCAVDQIRAAVRALPDEDMTPEVREALRELCEMLARAYFSAYARLNPESAARDVVVAPGGGAR